MATALDSPDWRHFWGSLQKIKLIKTPIKHFFIKNFFIKSETSDSFVNHFDGHFAYLKTLDFYFNDNPVITSSNFFLTLKNTSCNNGISYTKRVEINTSIITFKWSQWTRKCAWHLLIILQSTNEVSFWRSPYIKMLDFR